MGATCCRCEDSNTDPHQTLIISDSAVTDDNLKNTHGTCFVEKVDVKNNQTDERSSTSKGSSGSLTGQDLLESISGHDNPAIEENPPPSSGLQTPDPKLTPRSETSIGSAISAEKSQHTARHFDLRTETKLRSHSISLENDGAYLIYSNVHNGTYFLVWRKTYLPDAIAFGRVNPDVRVPLFKYKGRTEIARDVDKSKKTAMEGVLKFIRMGRPFKCKFIYYGTTISRLPEITLLGHKKDFTTHVIQPNDEIDVQNFDAVAACVSNTLAEKDLLEMESTTDMILSAFLTRCKRNSDSVQIISFN